MIVLGVTVIVVVALVALIAAAARRDGTAMPMDDGLVPTIEGNAGAHGCHDAGGCDAGGHS